MDRKEWEKVIKKASEEAGTYKDHFLPVIETLASILEKRDEAEKQFQATGGKPVVSHTNKGGNTNIVKNPALVVYMDLNTQALAYWRELGLTIKAYKQMGYEEQKSNAAHSFEKLLERLEW